MGPRKLVPIPGDGEGVISLEEDRPGPISRSSDRLESIARDLFDYLGAAFPVCCGSDEFHYFPQVPPSREGWTRWDDFSPEMIGEVKQRLSSAEEKIALLSAPGEGPDVRADAEALTRMARTLKEQLGEVRFYETQPTFHLTILCTGRGNDPRAWGIRARGVPSFLSRARQTLVDMPEPFRELGVKMIRDIRGWLRSLGKGEEELYPVFSGLERFEDFLRNARTRKEVRLPPEVYDRIVRDHIGCGAGVDEVRDAVREEIDGMGSAMDEICRTHFSGRSRMEAIRAIPLPEIPERDPLAVYRIEADALLRHCIDRGIVPEDLPRISPLRIATVPPYLKAIRAASAYSFTPGNRSQQGTFYIVTSEGFRKDHREDLVDYRMLTAHEAYPGHHLLDSWRWHFVSPVRRPLETPLFYEGWACFAEELMRMTGYFSGPVDQLLLANRRYRRAIRGMVDLDLQTGTLDSGSAARRLAESGFSAAAAIPVVTKYALRPGYQVCYSFGLRRFLELYSRYGTGAETRFVKVVLSCGEVGFDHVESALIQSSG